LYEDREADATGPQATAAGENTLAFGPFRLVSAQRLLLEDNKPMRLGSRAFDILAALVERAVNWQGGADRLGLAADLSRRIEIEADQRNSTDPGVSQPMRYDFCGAKRTRGAWRT
jgi:hypothetical protein